MDGYIRKEHLIKFANNHKNKQIDANDIARFPCADVVPKSEADEIAEELSDTIVMKDELFDEVIKLRGELANAKADVAREIFAAIDEFLNIVEWRSYWDEYKIRSKFAELKKKYTEENV